MAVGFLTGAIGAATLVTGLMLLARWGEASQRRERDASRPTFDAAQVRNRLRSLADASLLLLPAEEPGLSKLGGDPELPPDASWPISNGHPRTFLAQIDLEEARASGGPEWLPTKGLIFAFYDPDGHGAPDVVSVVYSRQALGAPIPAPAGARFRFPERRVKLKRVVSVPNLEWIGFQHYRLLDDDPTDWKELAELSDAPPGEELQHRLGGFPDEIQDEWMALTCARARLGRGLISSEPQAG